MEGIPQGKQDEREQDVKSEKTQYRGAEQSVFSNRVAQFGISDDEECRTRHDAVQLQKGYRFGSRGGYDEGIFGIAGGCKDVDEEKHEDGHLCELGEFPFGDWEF
mmetsp:Transcript_36098/g.41861  ORF Transcript_36098/g.41861 Transcript_36098/m.41861 type:complete len:105 (-) Transcript_36098:233-547(-)